MSWAISGSAKIVSGSPNWTLSELAAGTRLGEALAALSVQVDIDPTDLDRHIQAWFRRWSEEGLVEAVETSGLIQ